MLLRRGISMSTGRGSGGGGTTIYDANTSNLNGSNQYFQSSSAVTSGLSTLTFYAKIKTTTLAQDYIYFETTGSTGQTGFGIFQDGSSGNIKAGYRTASGGVFYTATTTGAPLSTSTWYTLIVTIDVSSDIKIYFDNIEKGSASVSTASIYGGSQADMPTVGAYNSGGTRSSHWVGGISFLGFQSRVITSDERLILSEAKCWDELGTLQNDSLAYWELANWDGHTGQELDDQSSNGNDLTNIGVTPFNGTGLEVECS